MKRKMTILLVSALVVTMGSTAALSREPDSHAGTAAAVFLRQGPGARPAAMGGAYVAAADDVYATHYNPAGLGFVGRQQATFEFNKSFQDISSSYLAYAHPLSDRSTIGASITYLGTDDLLRTQQSGSGAGATPVTGLGDFDANDLAVGISYGRLLNPDLTVGVTGKFIRQKIDAESASGFAVDLGVRYNPSVINGLRVGLAVQNIGPSIEFIRDDYDLPLNLKAGVAYGRPIFSKTDFLNVFFDVNVARDNDFDISLGTEYWVMNMLALRVGYDGRKDEGGGITAGAGFHIEDVAIDYGYVPFGDLGNQHRISASFRFGPTHERPAANYEQNPLLSSGMWGNEQVKNVNEEALIAAK